MNILYKYEIWDKLLLYWWRGCISTAKCSYPFQLYIKDKANKTLNKCTLLFLNKLEALIVSVVFNIVGIFYIIISNKLLSRIERHTYTFGCFCFYQNISIKSHLTYFNRKYSKSGVFWYHDFQWNQLEKIRLNSNKGESQASKTRSCLFFVKLCGVYLSLF